MNAILIVCGIIITICLLMLVRNEAVHSYRLLLIDAIHARNMADLSETGKAERRYVTFKSVSYDEMALQFWKPMREFWTKEELEIMIS